ncbi:MAG: hypothetical protein ACJ8R9_25850 [Steroidobacteraceae bacterium]
MRLLTLGRVGIVVAVFETLLLLHLWLSQEIVLISVPSPDKAFVAQVAMRRDFPYLSVDVYLVIRGGNTGHVAKRNFLVARDAFADLMLEVRSLSWNDGAIDLDIQSHNYSGPKHFQVD